MSCVLSVSVTYACVLSRESEISRGVYAFFFVARQALSELQEGGAQAVEAAEAAQALRSENEALQTRLDQVRRDLLNGTSSWRLGVSSRPDMG